MGTIISLDVAGVELISSKNHMGIDHGSLFQRSDRKPLRSDQIDYEYFEREREDPTAMEMAFVRSLKDIVPRLELLGFNLAHVKLEYDAVAKNWLEQLSAMAEDEDEDLPALMSFEEFREFALCYPLESLDPTYVGGFDDKSKSKVTERFREVSFERIPGYSSHEISAYSERSFFGGAVSILNPYSVLRLLADGKENQGAQVVWQYGPLVEGGYANSEDFVPEARRPETFLIATEGSSDVHVLQRALTLLRPEIQDFFRFVDVSEGHPFSGTGNLAKFAEGLAKIDVQNQVLFLFDNDAEGVEACRRVSKLTLPTNMRGGMLPELDAFRNFPAEGPEGLNLTDINRRAAAIECYLDLRLRNYGPPKVRWTNFKISVGAYHGALEFKESYVEHFLKQTMESISTGLYDVSKLEAVLDYLIAECVGIAYARDLHSIGKATSYW